MNIKINIIIKRKKFNNLNQLQFKRHSQLCHIKCIRLICKIRPRDLAHLNQQKKHLLMKEQKVVMNQQKKKKVRQPPMRQQKVVMNQVMRAEMNLNLNQNLVVMPRLTLLKLNQTVMPLVMKKNLILNLKVKKKLKQSEKCLQNYIRIINHLNNI